MSPRFAEPPRYRAVAQPCGHEVTGSQWTSLLEPYSRGLHEPPGQVVTGGTLIVQPCGHYADRVDVTPLDPPPPAPDPRIEAAATSIARDLGTDWEHATLGEQTLARIMAEHALAAADVVDRRAVTAAAP